MEFLKDRRSLAYHVPVIWFALPVRRLGVT